MEDYTQTHLAASMTLLAIQEENTTTFVPTSAKEHHKPSFFASFASRRCNVPNPLKIVAGPKSTPAPTRSFSAASTLSRRKSLLVRTPSNPESDGSDTTPVLSPSSSITSNGSSTSSTSARRRRSMASSRVERFSVHLSPEPTPSSSRTPSLASNNSESDSTPQTPSDAETPASPGLYSPNGYSNFYLRLPNGKWMLRYRTKDREILGTEEVDMCLI